MQQIVISLEKALELEERGEIVLIDFAPKSHASIIQHPRAGKWSENYEQIKLKYRTVPTNKILQTLAPKYLVEINEGLEEGTIATYIWRYIHGLESSEINLKEKDNTEYVYILVNPGYPNLVKIGMTARDVSKRAKKISGAGTVFEWVPKYALPVREGTAYTVENLMHREFARFRVSSDLGSKREFFELSPLTALDKLREIGSFYRVGNVVEY